jgi:plasmid stabilization system protein ParE
MTFRVRVRSPARDDIRDARDWYERQSSGLGEEFGHELDQVLVRIAGVYFLVEGERVNVFRILHQARDPRELRR